jgi:hypothetical protein
MTERDLGNTISWWIGEVVNVKDPDQSGRVQVRVYGRHDDTSNIPDSDLPWALPLQPVTSAAYGKIGTTPLGLVRGSKVMGFWMDSDQQYPVIWGSFGKAGDEVPGQTENGTQKIDTKTGSIPGAAQNYSDPTPNYPFSNLYGSKIDITKINNEKANTYQTIATYTPATGVDNKFTVDNKLKEPKKPTTASAKKDDKSDVLDIVKQVDPDKSSRALTGMVDGFMTVRNVMSLTSPAGLTNMLSGGLQGVISGLAGKIGLGAAMGIMNGLASSGQLSGIAQNALKQAVASTAINVLTNGNIPLTNTLVSTNIPKFNPKIGHPPTSLIVAAAASTAVQQYFDIDKEPYPGYIQYIDSSTKLVTYRLRGNEPHYASAQDHIKANSSDQMLGVVSNVVTSGALNGVIGSINSTSNLNLGAVALPSAAAKALAGAVTGGLESAATQGIASILGKGVNLGNITSLASKLLPGALAGGIQGLMGGHLPTSVMDIGKVGKTMNGFTKNQALLQVKKNSMIEALNPNGDIDAKLAYANKKLAESEITKLGKVTY